MKRTKLLTLLITLLFAGSNVFAASIDMQTARTVAFNFYKLNPKAIIKSNMAVVLTYAKTEADSSVDFYVFDIYPVHSFVIVSGNNIVKPILAYSTESYFANDANSKVGISDWMGQTAAKIRLGIQEGVSATSQIQNQWTSYINGNNAATLRGTGAGPLLATTWDQSPNYNAQCPYATDGTGEQCVTGCVATTMAQIMKFWNYPNQGKGSFSYTEEQSSGYNNNIGTLSANFGTTTYNWGNMPAGLNGSNADVATLMLHCGISVTMDYGDDNQGGSGSYVLESETPRGQQSAEYSYKTYFLYNPNTLQGVVYNNYSETGWISLLENEINSGRPVQYEGQDINGYGGHTWVCDGYDVSGMLHMNWGWSGADDGYFEVTNLNANIYNFDADDAALIGIEPLQTVHATASVSSAIICTSGSTTLIGAGPKNATYSWSPTTGVTCPTCATTTAKPGSTTTYILKVDSSGVIATLSVAVNVATGISSSFIPDVTSVCSAPGSVMFNNSSANATSYLWEFGDGTTSTDASPTHTYNSTGKYTVKLIATGACGVNSLVKSSLISVNDNDPTVSPGQNVCRNNIATLTATGNGTINWYTGATGGTPVATGSTYVTPGVYAPATFYAESDLTPPAGSCGPVSYYSSFGSGSIFSNYNSHVIYFNCFKPQTLVSVDVYASGEADSTIQLADSNGNVITSGTFDIPDGLSTVTLNFALPVGNNYELSCGGTVDLYRNNAGAHYPYYSNDSSIVLTNSDAGITYYYYFYNWKLQEPGCVSARVPVNISLLNPGTEFTTQITGTTVNFTPANPTATSFLWNFGDGATSTEATPTHTYATGGTYTIKLDETGVCTDSFSQIVDLRTTGIDNVNLVESFSLSPNPTSGNLLMDASVEQADGYTLNVENMLGETIITQNVHLNNGDNKLSIDVSSLASGMYLFRLTEKDGQVAAYRKFVKD